MFNFQLHIILSRQNLDFPQTLERRPLDCRKLISRVPEGSAKVATNGPPLTREHLVTGDPLKCVIGARVHVCVCVICNDDDHTVVFVCLRTKPRLPSSFSFCCSISQFSIYFYFNFPIAAKNLRELITQANFTFKTSILYSEKLSPVPSFFYK